MGEATYYMKARFASEAAAKKALPKVREFILEGIAAQDYWQNNRGKKPAKFWPEFNKQFPLVSDYLDTIKGTEKGTSQLQKLNTKITGKSPSRKKGRDCNNELAGKLDFGYGSGSVENLEQSGDIILYYETVWHFADWDPFMAYLKSKYGAVRASWISDEYLEPFSMIDV